MESSPMLNLKLTDMKRFVLTVLLGFFLMACWAQESSADLGVAAIGMVVSDIEKSEKFYTEIIGMTPAGSFDLSPTWSKEAGAANGQPFSVKMFKMVDRDAATILKLAYFDKVEARPEQLGVNDYAGVNYLTFNYTKTSFQQVISRLDKANIEKLGGVKREGYQLIFIKDPDGIFIELVGPPDI